MAFGLSGLFKNGLSQRMQFIYAFIFVSAIRLASSTLSGVILWSSSIEYASNQVEAGNESPNIATRIFAFVGNKIWLYSLGYNFIYIATTLATTLVIGLLVYKRLQVLNRDYFLAK